jgi:hypothetical protein
VSNAVEYFNSGSTFTLSEGEHYLDASLTVENVTNITLIGEGAEALILVSAGSGISFVSSQEILFSSLDIVYSGMIENSSHSALLFQDSYSVQINHTSFTRLDSDHHARALMFVRSAADITSCSFVRGHDYFGGALFSDHSNISFSGVNSYIGNTALVSGGAVFANNSMLVFNGDNIFTRNTARTLPRKFSGGGDAIYLSSSEIALSGSVEIQDNGGVDGGEFLIGVALLAFNATVSIEGEAIFTDNRGGAVTLLKSHFICIGRARFANNRRNEGSFGAAMYIENSTVVLDGEMDFINNTVSGGVGGAIFSFNSTIDLHGSILFASNRAETGGALYLDRSIMRHTVGNITQVDNYGGHKGGGVYATNSTIQVSGISNYVRNRAMLGGAVGLEVNSEVVLQAPVAMIFEHNEADFGAGIFYSDLNAIVQCQSITIERENCFFGVETADFPNISNIQLTFDSNRASRAGSVLYGGSLQTCGVQVNGRQVVADNYAIIQSIITVLPIGTRSPIASDPLSVCFCFNNITDCSERRTSISVRRGQPFHLPVITVGQLDMPVPTSIRAYIDGNSGSSELVPQSHILDEIECTDVEFQVFAERGINSIQLIMFPDGPCGNIANTRTFVGITLEDCPPGFDLVGKRCTCEERLLLVITNELHCNVDTGLIRKPSNSWVKPIWDRNLSAYLGFIWNPQCRTSYCKQGTEGSSIWLNFSNPDSDDQCAENRAGISCGACKPGHSLVLSSFDCEVCDNRFVSLLLFFGVAGIALIAILFALQITVATGAINGLILYVNLINICRDLFFPPLKTRTNPLTVFIAWMNLDFGIETCFYNGLDSYSYAWLQFAFPFYLWFLIGVIIFSSKVSAKVGKLFGSNPIAVLSTVILMSFTKLLQTSVEILSSIVLEYPLGRRERVWSSDPNVLFLKGKHIILSVAAIFVVTFLLLPYIFLLTFGYQLQAFSGRKGFTWFNNFKPLLDAYYAPFKKGMRYWTGFLLFVRSGIFLSFAVSVNSNINLIAVSALFTGIAVIPWLSKRIYEKLYLDALEASFILNFCILSSVTYHVQTTDGDQVTLTYAFVGIAFAEFVGIVIFHVCLRFKLIEYLQCRRRKKVKLSQENHTEAIEMDNTATVSVFELREPLLDDTLEN